jgi:hypothetical protein
VITILKQNKEAERLLRFFVTLGYSYYIFSEVIVCGKMQANNLENDL